MRKLLILLTAVAISSVVSAAECPPEVPPEARTRIVECTDETFAVQRLINGSWRTSETRGCGQSLESARRAKASATSAEKTFDAIVCPPQPKQPIVVVE